MSAFLQRLKKAAKQSKEGPEEAGTQHSTRPRNANTKRRVGATARRKNTAERIAEKKAAPSEGNNNNKRDAAREESTRQQDTSSRKKKKQQQQQIVANLKKRKRPSKRPSECEKVSLDEDAPEDKAAAPKPSSPRPAPPPAPAAPVDAYQKAPPEATTCSTESIAALKKQMDIGKISGMFEDMKTSMKPFALRAASLTAPGVIQEYLTHIRAFVPEKTTRVCFDRNVDKNRYKDVICADRDRVILVGTPCDYIHANHVRGPPLSDDRRLICTQGPTGVTTIDFWRMVKQENVHNVVMLCETRETGKDKCFQYWPLQDNETMKLDAIDVVIVNGGRFVHDPGFVTTVLEFRCAKPEKSWQVFHHQWKTWPDRGVPDRTDVVLKTLQLIRGAAGGSASIVHCSAGIGRTGTIVAVEFAIQLFIRNKPVDVSGIVKLLREKRMHSVQTDLQYVFIYKALMQFISSKDPDPETLTAVDDFLQSITTLVQGNMEPAPVPVQPAAAPPPPVAAPAPQARTPTQTPSAEEMPDEAAKQ